MTIRSVVTALLLLAPVAGAAGQAVSPAEVVAVEREFAADAARRGWVAAFKKYAAADAIVLRAAPVNAQQSLADRPDEPADTSLAWWPVAAGIAKSGDLGFTTGPFTVGGDTSFGHYFTVWQRQADGTWRWMYDGGPRNDAKSPLGPDTEPVLLPVATETSSSAERAWSEVGALEVALADRAVTDARSAYLDHLSKDARLMGSPAQPATDDAARRAELDRRAPAMQLAQLGGRASLAGDLVFTYGDARWTLNGQQLRGHYVRIWQKRAEGWKLVFDEILAVRTRPS